MTVPTYDRFIEPILRFLGEHPSGESAKVVHEAAATALALSESDKEELLPSGMQAVYRNRAGWAHDRLKRAGLSTSPRRGYWKLTEAGRAFCQKNTFPLDQVSLAAITSVDLSRRLSDAHAPQVTDSSQDQAGPDVSIVSSPDDRLEQALNELREAAERELLELLATVSPSFFEVVVLDLLHRLGYGASRSDLQRVGGTGDGGIDGVISLDKLGLEKVYVQAKRWQGNVGRPDLQAFYGALAGQKARKGVFITTSGFTQQALEFARSVEGIVLIDGVRLAGLMVENQVGVTSRTVKIPKIDGDYFDEETA